MKGWLNFLFQLHRWVICIHNFSLFTQDWQFVEIKPINCFHILFCSTYTEQCFVVRTVCSRHTERGTAQHRTWHCSTEDAAQDIKDIKDLKLCNTNGDAPTPLPTPTLSRPRLNTEPSKLTFCQSIYPNFRPSLGSKDFSNILIGQWEE